MRFKGRLELEQGMKQYEIVPFVNLVFLLLLFVIFSLIFQSGPGTRIKLPRNTAGTVSSVENLEILVTSDSTVYFNGDALSSAGLETVLKQAANRNQPLLLKADKSVALNKISQIWDKARECGIRQINILTD
jgi:biopolymer transport protein ExbD